MTTERGREGEGVGGRGRGRERGRGGEGGGEGEGEGEGWGGSVWKRMLGTTSLSMKTQDTFSHPKYIYSGTS